MFQSHLVSGQAAAGGVGGWRAQSRSGAVGPHLPDSALAGEGALLLGWWGPREPGWDPETSTSLPSQG